MNWRISYASIFSRFIISVSVVVLVILCVSFEKNLSKISRSTRSSTFYYVHGSLVKCLFR